ncbi:MAG: ATP-binding protein [Legionella sp.]|nr:ATP-binding protein [Legionella sp.]
MAYKQHLIETRGTGIKLIFESCKKANIKKPEYHEEGDFVKVIFYFEPDISSYDNEDNAIMAFIALQQSVTAKQVAEFLSVSHNTAIRKLGDLIATHKINKTGNGPSVKYISPPTNK